MSFEILDSIRLASSDRMIFPIFGRIKVSKIILQNFFCNIRQNETSKIRQKKLCVDIK
jgi:hypothetical protein